MGDVEGGRVGEIDDAIAQRSKKLRDQIAELTAELGRIPRQKARHEDAYQRLVATTKELLDFEETVPKLRAEPARAAAARRIRLTLRTLAAEAALLAILPAIPGLFGWGWLALVIPYGLLTLWGASRRVDHGTYRAQQAGAIALAAGGILLPLITTSVLSDWSAIALLLLAGIGAFLIDPTSHHNTTRGQVRS